MLGFTILTSFILFLSIVYARPTERRSLSVNDPSLPAAVKLVCKGGMNATTVSESKPFGTDGVTITTGFCTPPDSDSDPATNLAATVPVVRQTCITALNDCTSRFGNMFQGHGWVSKCGAPCRSACYPGSGGPDPADCQHIFDSMLQDPALFTLDKNAFSLLAHGSCGTGIQNQIAASPLGCSQTMIYNHPDWAAIGSYLAWNCQAPQGARGGKCTGTTGIYDHTVPDYYVQVYAN